MYFLFIFCICIATAFLPIILKKIFGLKNTFSFLPIIAAVLFFVAFLIPDIDISKETDSFQQHLVGGGLYCACLYFYLKQIMKWRFVWYVDLVLLLAFTSAFGVANELLEFTLVKLNIQNINLADADWDLLANTLGAVTGFIIFQLYKKIRMT
jgi:hypothetical protein